MPVPVKSGSIPFRRWTQPDGKVVCLLKHSCRRRRAVPVCTELESAAMLAMCCVTQVMPRAQVILQPNTRRCRRARVNGVHFGVPALASNIHTFTNPIHRLHKSENGDMVTERSPVPVRRTSQTACLAIWTAPGTSTSSCSDWSPCALAAGCGCSGQAPRGLCEPCQQRPGHF